MSELISALVGGLVGSGLTVIGVVAARLSALPGEVALHDRRAAALAEDLENWVWDDSRRVARESDAVTSSHVERGTTGSSVHVGDLAGVRTDALHRYRDRRTETRRAFADLLATESWPHAVYRRRKKRPALQLNEPGEMEAVVNEWRADVVYGEQRAPVFDPSRSTVRELVREAERHAPPPS